MSDFRKHLDKSLENEEFKKEWDNLELRYAVVEQLIKLRITYNLSQTELAKKIGTTQAVISRIENGTVNVGIDFLEKVARAFDKKVEISIF
ncbi:helix-turn-helix transcriptional regulator [bacterium]|nr:helix-turn-helix transcriptional regulator [bacterium]MBU1958128.1 helix-turn-helix transcriptional regulator [bacterium]